MTQGKRLSELLEDKKMTQKSLADLLSLDPSSITQFKKDKNNPSLETSRQIAKIFGVNLEWFLTGEGEKVSITQTSGANSPAAGPSSYQNTGTVSGGQVHTGHGAQHHTNFTPAPTTDNRVATLEEKIAGLEKLITEKDERIQDYKERIQELKEQLSTKQ